MKRPPLGHRMADQLERLNWAFGVLLESIPHRDHGEPYPLSPRESVAPSVTRLMADSQQLIDEQRRRRREA